jgi:hypothetical protein
MNTLRYNYLLSVIRKLEIETQTADAIAARISLRSRHSMFNSLARPSRPVPCSPTKPQSSSLTLRRCDMTSHPHDLKYMERPSDRPVHGNRPAKVAGGVRTYPVLVPELSMV